MANKKRRTEEEVEEVEEEEELEDGDIYDEQTQEMLLEEDEISAMEAAFMRGYNDA